jgi:hypothetical protein
LRYCTASDGKLQAFTTCLSHKAWCTTASFIITVQLYSNSVFTSRLSVFADARAERAVAMTIVILKSTVILLVVVLTTMLHNVISLNEYHLVMTAMMFVIILVSKVMPTCTISARCYSVDRFATDSVYTVADYSECNSIDTVHVRCV